MSDIDSTAAAIEEQEVQAEEITSTEEAPPRDPTPEGEVAAESGNEAEAESTTAGEKEDEVDLLEKGEVKEVEPEVTSPQESEVTSPQKRAAEDEGEVLVKKVKTTEESEAQSTVVDEEAAA